MLACARTAPNARSFSGSAQGGISIIKANIKRHPPTKPERYPPALLLSALTQSKGMIAAAARLLGCSRQTIYDSMRRHPEITEFVEGQRDLLLDTAELKLIEAVVNGQPWAILFYLKTQGKSRGYVEKQVVGITGGRTLEELLRA